MRLGGGGRGGGGSAAGWRWWRSSTSPRKLAFHLHGARIDTVNCAVSTGHLSEPPDQLAARQDMAITNRTAGGCCMYGACDEYCAKFALGV